MLLKEVLKKNSMNSIFINYGYVDKVGSGIATIKGLFNVSAGELVTIYPYKVKAIALNLGTNYIGLVLLYIFSGILVFLFFFMDTNIYYAAEEIVPLDLDDMSKLSLEEVQRRYQVNFEARESLLKKVGLVNETILPDKVDIHKSFLRKLYEYLTSFFSGTTGVDSQSTVTNFFDMKNSYYLENFFNIDKSLYNDIALLPKSIQLKMSFILSDIVINDYSYYENSNIYLKKFLSKIETTRLIYEDYVSMILMKDNPDFDGNIEKIRQDFFDRVYKYHPDQEYLLFYMDRFDYYLKLNFYNYQVNYTNNLPNLDFSTYTYENYIFPVYLKHFYNLNLQQKVIENYLVELNNSFTELQIYLKIESKNFLTGETLKNFLDFNKR